MAKKSSVKKRIEELFLANVGKVVTRQQLQEAARNPDTGIIPENWHQRLSELRVDHGYTIWAGKDAPHKLRNEQYMMPTAERSQITAKRVKPSAETWRQVLKRAHDRCEWHEDGQNCQLKEGDIDPIGGGRVRLTADHMKPHSVSPDADPKDPQAWRALCGRHQVMKKNFWDNTTGKMNVIAILQASTVPAKRQAFEFLTEFFERYEQR